MERLRFYIAQIHQAYFLSHEDIASIGSKGSEAHEGAPVPNNFLPIDSEPSSSASIANAIGWAVMRLFLETEGTDFFLLHLVTSYHALLPCLLYIRSEKDRLHLLECFSSAILAVYLVQGSKPLTPPELIFPVPHASQSPGFSSKDHRLGWLASWVKDRFSKWTHSSSGGESNALIHPEHFQEIWDYIQSRVVPFYQDEHVIKLVYVCKWNFDRTPSDEGKGPGSPVETITTSSHSSTGIDGSGPSGPQPDGIPIPLLSRPSKLLFILTALVCSERVATDGSGWKFH